MRFTEDHLWLLVDMDEVTLGVTDVAAEELGGVEFLELPEPGTMVAAGEELLVLEGANGPFEFAAPVDGEVVEVHSALDTKPGLVSDDPMGAAWLIKLRVEDPSEVEALLDEETYRDFVG